MQRSGELRGGRERETMPGNRLNMLLFYQTLDKIIGDKYGCKITTTYIQDKETGEVIYDARAPKLEGCKG